MVRFSGVFLICAVLLQPLWLFADEEVSREQADFFESQIRPVLANRCYQCHGEKKQEGGLRLDSRGAMLRGGDSERSAILPGDADKSPLIQAVRRQGDYEMPPEKPLPESEAQALAAWVKMGAPWPGSGGEPVLTKEEFRLQQYHEIRDRMWSLEPIQAPVIPPGDWGVGAVDRLILAKLQGKGLAPSPVADRRTLIRRAKFDLHGLPPTPAEVEQFVNDPAPDAWGRLIDRLLASPLYGQRWARHWLDVARYGDTKGYAFQQERRYPYSYTYRDYVIDAFNSDKPIDQFYVEQIAADRLDLPPNAPELAALGFLTVGRKFNDKHLDIDDRIDVVTRGMLGLTVSCARCHDHKYDAIGTEDYYSLYGVFASSKEPETGPLIGDPKMNPMYDEFVAEKNKLQGEADTYRQQQAPAIIERAREHIAEYLVAAATRVPEAELRQRKLVTLSDEHFHSKLVVRWRQFLAQRAELTDATLGFWRMLALVPDDQFADKTAKVVELWKKPQRGVAKGEINPLVADEFLENPPASSVELAQRYGKLMTAAWKEWQAAGGNAEALEKLAPPQRALAELVVGEGSPTNPPPHELVDYLNREQRNKYRALEKKLETLEATSPGAPPRAMVLNDDPHPFNPYVFIRGSAARHGPSIPRQFLWLLEPDRQPWQDSGRLQLARAIVAADNPLTARVFVNRVWMHHFGSPLVATPSDFGVRSNSPVQRELLDHLAANFIADGWSLKSLHREIMLSQAYRQQSIDRPDARAVDPSSSLYWKMNRQRLEFEPLRDAMLFVANRLDLSHRGRPVDIVKDVANRRRSVYAFIDRQDLPGLFRVFNLPNPDQHASRRPETIVPQQALFMLNSPFVQQQAAAVLSRPDVADAADPAQRIAVLYEILYSRPPREAESAVGKSYIETAPDAALAWQRYVQLLLMTNEFAFVD